MRSDWPQRAEVAVSLTFDVDCESGWLGEGEAYATRLSTLSEARFGATRGVPRILAIHNIQGTFYIPGDTAERHTDTCKAIVDAGHEVRHHGYLHLRSDAIDEARQREEIERGLEALDTRRGVTRRGYRSPSWKPGRGDAFTSPSDFLDTWLAEFESAREDRRHVTFTMHPEVIGRGYRAHLLDRLIASMQERGHVWFATHGDVAAWVES